MSIFRHSLLAGSLAVLAPAEVGPVIAAAPLRESSPREVNIYQDNTRAILLNRKRFSYEVTVEPLEEEKLPKPNAQESTQKLTPSIKQPNRHHNTHGGKSKAGHLISRRAR